MVIRMKKYIIRTLENNNVIDEKEYQNIDEARSLFLKLKKNKYEFSEEFLNIDYEFATKDEKKSQYKNSNELFYSTLNQYDEVNKNNP